jgi:hypothetical protein
MSCGLHDNLKHKGHSAHFCNWCIYEPHTKENDKHCIDYCEYPIKCGFVKKLQL